jgi:hypothetical protein
MKLLISKKPLPPEMKNAEHKVESWWQEQIRSLPADTATAILLLCRTAAAQFSKAWIGLDPENPASFHSMARSCLFALQTALGSLKGDLPPGEFPSTFVFSALPLISRQSAEVVLQKALEYAHIRDAYLTFKWGGYDVETPARNVLRFRDVPAWNGMRDDAGRRISQQIEEEKIRTAMPVLTSAGWPSLDSQYNGPQTLTFPEISVTQFVRGWSTLKQQFRRDLLNGEPSVVSLDQLVAIARQQAHFARETAEAFIRLISFDRKETAALTLFHCPLVPVTGSSYVVMFSAMLMSRLTTCINRLAVHRGAGYDSISKQIEEYYLCLIKEHYERKAVLVETNVPYTFEGIGRDIDIVVYERGSKRLLIGMLKAFINPDTVEEVVRANEQLAYGIEQAAKARKWLTTIPPDRRSGLLRLRSALTCQTIECAVVGNGFAGSDYLPLDPTIPVVDVQYLLRLKFRGGSIFEAISQYDTQIAAMMALPVASSAQMTSVTLGDVTFEFPAYTLSSQ